MLVVGGGPAGLEAARVAARRGHRVTLCERADALGGALRLAAKTYEPNGRLLRWLEAQVREAGVELRLGAPVTPALARELAPDLVLVASGARRARPSLPGAEQAHVQGGDDLAWLLAGEDPPVGARVAIVGAALAGVTLADYLSARGCEVTLLEEGPTLGAAMAHPRRWRALHELRERGVALLANARVQAIGAKSLHVASEEGGLRRELELAADHVVWLAGWTGDASLADALRAAGLARVEVIGDAGGVGYLEGAIHSGFHAAIGI